ncbi:MAG: alpha/beta hydrolase [Eubacteriales bacterium]|nr:alpha/beta hydrolase [Eubacteriales bacterium]
MKKKQAGFLLAAAVLFLSMGTGVAAEEARHYVTAAEENYTIDEELLDTLTAEEKKGYLDYMASNIVYDNLTSFDYEYVRNEFTPAFGMLYVTSDEESINSAADHLLEVMQNMEPEGDPESKKIYLWDGENIPTLSTDYTENVDWLCHSAPDFQPYLLEMLIPEDETPKGAVICVPGGDRGAAALNEAYETAVAFNELGYQCFLVQNRQNNYPWSPKESGVDVARAIRYVRAHAEEYRISLDEIAVSGASNGGATCVSSLVYYGDRHSVSEYFPDYVPDELDEISAVPDVFLALYPAVDILNGYSEQRDEDMEKVIDTVEEIPFPPTFLVIGEEDTDRLFEGALQIISACRSQEVPADLHVFEGAPHGFGGLGITTAGQVFENTAVWTELADTFMQNRYAS